MAHQYVRIGQAIPSSGIAMAARIFYNSGGVQQAVDVVDGVTSISVKRYSKIYVDCSGTISNQEDGNTPAKAFVSVGYRFNWGENLETTWSYPEGAGDSRDEDIGSCCAARVFTSAPGTKTVRIKARDSAGQESTLSFTVNVEDPGSIVVVSPSGAWPTFAAGSVAGLTYGADYRAKSGFSVDGLNDVLFIADGDPEDGFPLLPSINLESRTNVDVPATRSSNIRFVNADIEQLTWGGIGTSFSGAYGGRTRAVSLPPVSFYYASVVRNDQGETRANNIRHARGVFLHDTGELNEPTGEDYCVIGSANMMSFQGLDMHRSQNPNGGSAEHVMRPYIPWLVVRYCRMRATVVTMTSYFKGSADGCVYSEQPDSLTDHDFDLLGDYDADRVIHNTYSGTYGTDLMHGYGRPAHNCVVEKNQFGASGGVEPLVDVGYGPQNADAQNPWPPSTFDHSKEGVEQCSIRNNVFFRNTAASINLAGRYLVAADNRLNMGAGALANVSLGGTDFGATRVPDGWVGPYFTTSLPIPSAF